VDGFTVLQSILSAGFRLHRVNRVRLLRCAEEMGGKMNYVDLCQVRERGKEGEIESVREGEINGKKVTLISGCNITPYFTSKHSFSFSSLLLGFVEELR
jgi:hypothetical protein